MSSPCSAVASHRKSAWPASATGCSSCSAFGSSSAALSRGRSTQPGRNGVAVLDHGFWHRTFGGDAGAIGQSITIGGARYTIVGVLAEGARLPADVPGARVPSEADVYLPIDYGEAFSATAAAQRRSNSLGVLARSRATATPALIDEDLRRIGRKLQAAFPQTNEGLTMNAISVRDLIVGDVRRPLLISARRGGLRPAHRVCQRRQPDRSRVRRRDRTSWRFERRSAPGAGGCCASC